MLFGSHEKSLIFHGEGGDKGNSDGGSGERVVVVLVVVVVVTMLVA